MRAGERRMTLYEKRPRFLEFGEMIIKIEVIVNGKNKVKDVASEAERARTAMLSLNERYDFSYRTK
jgi:hypothetical protein